jgi:hypothetical protein
MATSATSSIPQSRYIDSVLRGQLLSSTLLAADER